MARVRGNLEKPVELPGNKAVSQFLSQSRRKKAAKGTVVVQVFKERLRLCWSYLGKRYFLYIGLPDSKVNRVVADQKARWIEGDMATGNFDLSLKKYKPEIYKVNRMLAIDLLKQFIDHKSKEVYSRSLEKYQATLKHLDEFLKEVPDRSVTDIDAAEAEDFANWLSGKITPITAKERLTVLSACWNWGIKQGMVEVNPWQDLVSRIKVPPRQMPKPFTREEMRAIILGFRNDRYYCHYADYVAFLFGTGCRTAEAIGLRWRHCSEDCSIVWIGESLSRGVRKTTKTNRARTITLTPNLQAMLLARRPTNPVPDGLVFTSPKGEAIDDNNFRNRAWKTVLIRLEIDYRKPYTTRHTLISHALDLGMNPVMVAQLTGHDVETLYENYAGNVNSRPRLPELL